jgi:hypothetical protein
MTTVTSTPAAHNIDSLGSILAQIAALTKQADAIKDAIKEDASLTGDKSFEGELFKATYIETNRSVVDSKALFAELGATPEQIARHTKVTAVFSVKVTSR